MVEIEEAQVESLLQLVDRLEQESRDIKQDQIDRTLFPGRAVILNKEVDQFRAFVLDWVCHGLEGKDIPNNIPLTRPQIRILNERVWNLAAQKGVQMTLIPLPPREQHTNGIPPPNRQRDQPSSVYYPITGTYEGAPAGTLHLGKHARVSTNGVSAQVSIGSLTVGGVYANPTTTQPSPESCSPH